MKEIIVKIKDYLIGREIDNYGIASLMKDYCKWPQWLPFPFEINHGWYMSDIPRDCDIKSPSPIILVYNLRQKKIWGKVRKKTAIIIGAPFVQYRIKNKIKQSKNAVGTIAFPIHHGTSRTNYYDEEKYVQDLQKLPEKFKPITICLHYDDIRRGRDKKFINKGFKIITVGHRHDKDFAKKFYNIIKNAKYITSNSPGTIVLYSVEMGIPFFIYGAKPTKSFDKIGNKLVSVKNFYPLKEYINQLFSLAPDDVRITAEQRKFIEIESGIKEAVSPEELYKICMKNFIFKILPQAVFRLILIPVIMFKHSIIKN